MAIKAPTHYPTPPLVTADDEEFYYGWREEVVPQPDGDEIVLQIPLTAEEALHPEENFESPESRVQDLLSAAICEMLRPHCARKNGRWVVARNLLIKWDKPELREHAPDVCVIPNVKNPDAHWKTFFVQKEDTRPFLIIELVSEESKKHDRVTKVDQYARAEVQEYVYIDYWNRRGQTQWEIAGFQLNGDRYLPMLPDEDGSVYLETVGVRMGVEDGRVWMEDYETGERLLTNEEAQQRRKTAESRADAAEKQAAEERAARLSLEAKLAELEAQLKKQPAKQ